MAQSATTTIPTQDQEALSQHIQKAFEEVPQEQGPNVKQAFCNAWPAARTGLEGLRAVLNFVPGVNVFAGPAITVVLSAGDAAQKAVCQGG
jgi:hypothetical protein